MLDFSSGDIEATVFVSIGSAKVPVFVLGFARSFGARTWPLFPVSICSREGIHCFGESLAIVSIGESFVSSWHFDNPSCLLSFL